jgi:hypothetical protein
MNPSRIRIAIQILMLMLVSCSALHAEPWKDKESVVLDIQNLLPCDSLAPYIGFKYPDFLKVRGDVLVLEHQYLGYMVTLEPGKDIPTLPFFQVVVMLVKSYDKTPMVMEHYLQELDSYMLEKDFGHHTISDVVLADGETYYSIPGRGYVVAGTVTADGPLQGLSFSEEFRNYVLPGNVNLRVIFKYPTPAQNNDMMRTALENILSSLVVHIKYFNMSGDSSLKSLKHQ